MSDYVDVNPKTDCSMLKDDTLVSFVPMTNVQEKNNVVDYDLVPYSQVKKGFTVFQKGDMLWAKITPCMQNGKSCIADQMPTKIGFGSTEFHVVRKRNDNVYMPFIWAVFSNDDVLKAAQATFSGSAGQQRVSASFIEQFPAVLPDYDTQVELVKGLENKLSDLNQKLQQANALLTGMDDYVLDALKITMPEYSQRLICAVTLANIRADNTMDAGYYHPERVATIRMMQKSHASVVQELDNIVDFYRNIVSSADSPQKYLGLAGVQANTGELSGVDEEAAGQAFSYNKGDILYGRLRPYLNKVLLAENEGICSTEFHVMRVKKGVDLLPAYLAAIMRSSLILTQTRHMMTGNTHPRISNDDVKNLYIPVPDIDTQKKIAEEVIRRRQKARSIKQEAELDWVNAKAQFEKELLGGIE